MEELGNGKLFKFGGGAIALLGVVLGVIGTTSMGLFALYGAMVLVGIGLIKVGERIDQRAAVSATKSRESKGQQ